MGALLCIPALSIASPDSAIAGPYNVSFDLGLPKTAYKVNVTEGGALGNHTVNIKYNVGISRMAIISIMEGGPMLLPEEIEAIPSILFSVFGGLKNINTSTIRIDGTNGTLTTGEGSLLGLKINYNQAIYYPSNDTGVLIVSTYPWNEGTRQLLDSAHVEKINATF
jgi:hypothetical protein